MRTRGLFVMNLLLLLGTATGMARMSTIRAHRKDSAVSMLQQPETTGTNTEKAEEGNKKQTLDLIFSPTAKQVSDENKELLEAMETGLHSLRTAFNILTRLIHLLPEGEKQTPFTVDKQEYNVSEMLSSLEKLIIDGEQQQRNLIQGTAGILHKLATPSPPSQTAQQV